VFVRSAYLERVLSNEIIDNGLFPFGWPENPAHTLDILAGALAPSDNNRHAGRRHIDALIEYAG
jgi:hypothetical protein